MVLAIVVGVIAGWFAIALAVALFIGRAADLGQRHHRRMVVVVQPLFPAAWLDSTRQTVEVIG